MARKTYEAKDVAEMADCSINTARKYMKLAGLELTRGKFNVASFTKDVVDPIVKEIKAAKTAKLPKADKKAAPKKSAAKAK